MAMAAIAAFALFLPGSSCKRTIDPNTIVTNREVVRFLIRSTPEIFSNAFLDTSAFTFSGTGISFSREYSVKNIDTFIILNDLDTVGGTLQPKFPIEAGAVVTDTFLGMLRIVEGGTPRNKGFRLPVNKFGYFLKLDSDAQVNKGWVLWSVTQVFAGGTGVLDSVRLSVRRGAPATADTLILRRPRSSNPETDPQLMQTRQPYELKLGDSVEVRAWVPDTSYFVLCHISDLNTFRRVQLRPDSAGRLLGGFKISNESGLHFHFRRLAVDAFTNFTITDPIVPVRNEIWGILYQVVP